MCAAVAGQRGRRVAVIDHAAEPGGKIVISGGGRCNFTNRHVAPDRYLSANPHFARSALGRYPAQDFVDLVERHRIAWHEKTLGQLFCDGSARQIVRMLLDECEAGAVTLRLGEAIRDISHADGRFTVTTDGGRYEAPALVIATGGPSIPKLGATGFAYDLARRFGLKVVEPRPALVPLTLPPEQALFRSLSGVAVPVVARCGKAAFAEAALFTPSRAVGAGDPPGFILLEARTGGGNRLPARPHHRLAARGQACASPPRRAQGAGGGASRSARRDAGRPARRRRHARRRARRNAGRMGAAAGELDVPAQRQRRLRQGGGDGGRHRHRWPVAARPVGKAPPPGFMRSGRRWTSPAGWAATTSIGRGRVAGRRRRGYRAGTTEGRPMPGSRR